jgi:hypothetical protein
MWGASFELTARLGRPVHINMFAPMTGGGLTCLTVPRTMRRSHKMMTMSSR